MTTLSLPTDLGIEAACTLYQQLAQYLPQSTPVYVDARHVSRIHSASIQVLCAWVIARNKRGHKTIFNPTSAALSDAAHVLGVAQCLALPMPCAPSTIEKINE